MLDRARERTAEIGAQNDLAELMNDLGRRARAASAVLATTPTNRKNAALAAMADGLRSDIPALLAANAADVQEMRAGNAAAQLIERGTLSPTRIDAMAKSLEEIAALPDPVGVVIAAWERPNGLKIERVRTPLGVIGVIYESRPNVTVDAAGLTLKAGNAAILRGGSDTIQTNRALYGVIRTALGAAGLPEDAALLVPMTDRAAVGHMLRGLQGTLDVIVPRGGRGLVERVQAEARVPVFAHLEGLCHIYIDQAADLAMAVSLVVNAKMRRTSICGAAETLLVHRAVAASHLPSIATALTAAGCALRGDAAARAFVADAQLATEADWRTEYLDAILSIRVVDDLDAAIAHIEAYGSHHTDAIVTDDADAAEAFLNRVDSAIVMHNASTQFADGGEFGMGAEIGIATGRMHARGPVGLEQLTSFKYCVRGAGQTRP